MTAVACYKRALHKSAVAPALHPNVQGFPHAIDETAGTVVGKTSSGKDIHSIEHANHAKIFRMGSFDGSQHGSSLPRAQAVKTLHQKYKAYTAQDHKDAAAHHLGVAQQLVASGHVAGRKSLVTSHMRLADAHGVAGAAKAAKEASRATIIEGR